MTLNNISYLETRNFKYPAYYEWYGKVIDDYIVVFRRSSELHYGTTEGIALSDDQYYSLYFLLNPHYENNLLTRESCYEIVKKYYLTHKEDFYYFK